MLQIYAKPIFFVSNLWSDRLCGVVKVILTRSFSSFVICCPANELRFSNKCRYEKKNEKNERLLKENLIDLNIQMTEIKLTNLFVAIMKHTLKVHDLTAKINIQARDFITTR